jgi:hypothetical protein
MSLIHTLLVNIVPHEGTGYSLEYRYDGNPHEFLLSSLSGPPLSFPHGERVVREALSAVKPLFRVSSSGNSVKIPSPTTVLGFNSVGFATTNYDHMRVNVRGGRTHQTEVGGYPTLPKNTDKNSRCPKRGFGSDSRPGPSPSRSRLLPRPDPNINHPETRL